jgi:hypothetical protein
MPRQRLLKILTIAIGIIAIIAIVSFLLYHHRRKPRNLLFDSPNALSPLSKLALRRRTEAIRVAATHQEVQKNIPLQPVKLPSRTRPMSVTPESQSESDYEEELPPVPPLLRLPSNLHDGLGDIIPWPDTATLPIRVARPRPSFLARSSFRSSVGGRASVNLVRNSRISEAHGIRFYQLQGTTPPELSLKTFSTSSGRSERPTYPTSSDSPPYFGTTSSPRSLTDKFQPRDSYSTPTSV